MSSWKDCVTLALLGTEKGGELRLPEALEAALAGVESMDRETQFLTKAGALALWRRTGWKPAETRAELSPAEPETSSVISGNSASHLRVMLGGGKHASLLPEWLGEAVRQNRRVPPELLPALLNHAKQNRPLRSVAMTAGGKRANWLATHNPDWSFAVAESPELWETGNREQRASILRALRAESPGEARARVEAVWKEEAADVRTAFLNEFENHLSIDDAPFLEAALDDRSKEVKRVAIDLLSRVPGSPFVARMLERAKPLLSWKPGRQSGAGSLEVTLPAEPDAAGIRDGLDPKGFGTQKVIGERAVLLVQILASTPLDHWVGTLDQSPAALLEAAKQTEFGRPLATAWAIAALRQKDAVWAEALIDSPVAPHYEFVGGNLLTLLPEAPRAQRLASEIRSGALDKKDYQQWNAFIAQLDSFSTGWPMEPAREILEAICNVMSDEGTTYYVLSYMAESMMFRLPEALIPDALAQIPRDKDRAAPLIDLLTFRQEALNALRAS